MKCGNSIPAPKTPSENAPQFNQPASRHIPQTTETEPVNKDVGMHPQYQNPVPLQPGGTQTGWTPYQQTSSLPDTSYPNGALGQPVDANRYQQQYSYRPQYGGPSSSNVTSSGFNIWGPFAGYGTRRKHIGWLMDGQAARQADLIKCINQRFEERGVQGVSAYWMPMTAKGIITETRPYFLVRKDLISLALNIGIFGKDLFISMATYLKPPISQFRVMVLLIASAFAFFGRSVMLQVTQAAMSDLASSFNPFGGGYDTSAASTLYSILCFLGPLWFLMVIGLYLALIFSIYKYFTEKDFLAILRTRPNEFDEDDLMALEKAVEQTVRSSLDDIGLNPADLKPAAVQGNEIRLI